MYEGCQSVAWLSCSTLIKLRVAGAVIALPMPKVIHGQKVVSVPPTSVWFLLSMYYLAYVNSS